MKHSPPLLRSFIASHCSFKSTTESVTFYEYLTRNAVHKIGIYCCLCWRSQSKISNNFGDEWKHPGGWWLLMCLRHICSKKISLPTVSPKAGTAHLHVPLSGGARFRLVEVDAAEPFAQVGREKKKRPRHKLACWRAAERMNGRVAERMAPSLWKFIGEETVVQVFDPDRPCKINPVTFGGTLPAVISRWKAIFLKMLVKRKNCLLVVKHQAIISASSSSCSSSSAYVCRILKWILTISHPDKFYNVKKQPPVTLL